MSAPRTLCLNMIVRNEERIIRRCLESVTPYLSYWVVFDTGSSDETPKVIQDHFEKRGISGELHFAEFKNFGESRNEALDTCRSSNGEFDYILLIDADMELVTTDESWQSRLMGPCYKVTQRNALAYENVRLIRRDCKARYVGVTHEYLEVDAVPERICGMHMMDHACGSNRGNKFERDIDLLLKGLDAEPQNTRHMYYLAQSYRDLGRYEEALEWYRRRTRAGGWDEEAWHAAYQAAMCLRQMGDASGFVAAALESWDMRPWRAEPLAALAHHYRELGRHQLASEFAAIGLRIPYPDRDSLFIEEAIYRWGFAEHLSISGFYASDSAYKELGRSCCERLTTDPRATEAARHLARQNVRFYAHDAQTWLGMSPPVKLELTSEQGWHFLNPSICRADDKFFIILRQSNFHIEQGQYVINDPQGVVYSRNHLAHLEDDISMSSAHEIIRDARSNKQVLAPRFSFPVRGYEDCRLIRWQGSWWASATSRDTTPDGTCEMLLIELDDNGHVIDELILRGDWSGQHQKNWMPLVDGDQLFLVYSLGPTVVLRFDRDTRSVQHYQTHEPTAKVEHLRGGSQIVRISDGWLGICHEAVLHPHGAREYLHRFFMLDAQMKLVALSDVFRFTGAEVEFCAGLALEPCEKSLLVSFGAGDTEALVARIALDRVLGVLRAID